MATKQQHEWNDGGSSKPSQRMGIQPKDWIKIRNTQAERQQWKCAICRRCLLQSKVGPVLDHCHTTGSLRGVLCGQCNAGLGMFRDDPVALASAIQYLLRHTQ